MEMQETKSRWFGIWFAAGPGGPLLARVREPMTAAELRQHLNPDGVREHEGRFGHMTVQAIPKHRFYAMQH